MFIVCWESRCVNEPPDGLANGWKWRCQNFETKSVACMMYNSLLPGPGGDFGPILYRNIMYAEVLSIHGEERTGFSFSH